MRLQSSLRKFSAIMSTLYESGKSLSDKPLNDFDYKPCYAAYRGKSKNCDQPVLKYIDFEEKYLKSCVHGNYGEDAFFIVEGSRFLVFGVADGVGGWARSGIDSSKFSGALVKHAARNTVRMLFNETEEVTRLLPSDIMSKAYEDLLTNDKQAYGSSTACFVVVDNIKRKAYISNIGDSGCLVYKKSGECFLTEPQHHYENCPFQLSLRPGENSRANNGDKPSCAKNYKIKLEYGDVIILGTDGVWDNVDVDEFKQGLNIGVNNRITRNNVENLADVFFKHVEINSEWFQCRYRRNPKSKSQKFYGAKIDDISFIVASFTETF